MKLAEGVAEIDDLEAFLGELDAISDAHEVTVQAFDARYVVDREHLALAVELADRAFDRGENIARERGVELLLFAAGRRQINRALELGVDQGRQEVVVLVDADDAGDDDLESGVEVAAAGAVADLLEPAETLGRYDPALVRDFFDVGDAELAAVDGDLPDLVRERVALLVVER